MEQVISEEEIRRAVWDIGTEKAPGPDGFSFAFLKAFWDVIKGDILLAVKHFESSGSFDKGCNSSFLALIPKIGAPISLNDYRPISLLNCFYKIVAKILANRLSRVIGPVIGPEETAFIKGMSILDGPLIISEVLAWVKKIKKKVMFFKIDFV